MGSLPEPVVSAGLSCVYAVWARVLVTCSCFPCCLALCILSQSGIGLNRRNRCARDSGAGFCATGPPPELGGHRCIPFLHGPHMDMVVCSEQTTSFSALSESMSIAPSASIYLVAAYHIHIENDVANQIRCLPTCSKLS